jgi:anti-anti-sigma factor
MEAIFKKENGILTVSPSGRLDTVSSAELKDQIDAEGPDGLDIHMDFSGIEYISSAGLRLLVALQKKTNSTGNKLIIKNVGKVVNQVFSVAGFNKILTIE